MKCPRCKGKGKYKTILGDMVTCDFCWGTGEYEPFDADVALDELDGGITNEEYIRDCSSEQLAELICEIATTDVLMDRFFNAEIVNGNSKIEEAKAWLREKHDEKNSNDA